MKNIVREVFSLPAMDVVKASYKNSVYYLAGSSDITAYVSKIKESFDVTELDAISYGLQEFLRQNPLKDVLKVPKFDLVVLYNKETSNQYLGELVSDFFRKDDDEVYEIINKVNQNGSAVVGTYTYEIAHTISCMIETSNEQTKHVLNTDIVPVYNTNSMDSLELIEKLIRRDFPGDI